MGKSKYVCYLGERKNIKIFKKVHESKKDICANLSFVNKNVFLQKEYFKILIFNLGAHVEGKDVIYCFTNSHHLKIVIKHLK